MPMGAEVTEGAVPVTGFVGMAEAPTGGDCEGEELEDDAEPEVLSAAFSGALATGTAGRLSRASAASSTDASLTGAGTPRGEREGLAAAEPVVVV